ncbi:uncharacterized protein troap isoform X1 [Eleginops maclovinus]|uniref:uncharacterized protein troap isoform X1 n=1 Tax=Eleginops maclovinus TaxID=56733 RepID=UPI0030810975
MDSSPVLRPQIHKKICSELMRTKNENNKMPAHPKPSKLFSAHHLSNHNIENQDPGKSEFGRKAPLRPGISRIPVRAKSLHLPTASDFSQSHYKWEDNPLTGKTRKKKPCTRPVPFNFSQPKSSRLGRENQKPFTVSQSRTGTNADNIVFNSHLKTQNVIAKPNKHPAALMCNIDSSKGTGTFRGKVTDNALQTSATLFKPQSSIPNNAVHQSREASPAGPADSAEACSDNMSLLSLKDPSKTSNATQKLKLTTHKDLSKISTDQGDNFQLDHAALLSILRNEGLNATGLASTTPYSKPYNNLPQRVSIMSQQKAGSISGLMKSVHFSPDSVALQSILQNKGVKAGGPVGDTHRLSVCSSRGTPILKAQRVPVKKNRVEATEGPVALKTPQRVPHSTHQPMSAMRVPVKKNRLESTEGPVVVGCKETPLHLRPPQRPPRSTQRPMSAMSPFSITPRRQSCKSNLKPHQEEIVQKLFDDKEEKQCTHMADKYPEARAKPSQTQTTTAKTHYEVMVEASRVSTDEDEEELVRPFFHAPQRESVIFFSAGKTLLRAPRFEKQESLIRHEEHGLVLPVHEETRPVSTWQINPAQSLHKDFVAQKTSSPSPAVALLRKRLPALEELRMDEEVASYSSVHNAPGLHRARPRCGNPLAYTLHLEHSFTFVPIGFDLLSGCSSPNSSPLEDR